MSLKRRGMESEFIGKMLIGLAVLVLVLILIGIFNGKISQYIEIVVNFFKFR